MRERATITLVVVIFILGMCGAVRGQEASPESPGVLRYLAEQDRLFGDPCGLRSRLEESGLSVQLFYNHFFAWNARGGRNTSGAKEHSSSFDLLVRADLDAMNVVPGSQILLHVKNNWSRNVNPDVGALSDPVDDADFDELIYIAQFWWDQSLAQERANLRFGYLDQQVILDRNAYANAEDIQFLNTFLDNNNAIVPLQIGFGATLWLHLTERIDLIFGVADGENQIREAGFRSAFEDFENLVEYFEANFGLELKSPRGPLPGKYRFGVFYDPRVNPVFGRTDPVTGEQDTDKGHVGTYVSFDQMLYRESEESLEGLGAFLRYGYRDPDVNRIAQVWSTGIQYQGPLPGRGRDVLGLGMYQTIASDRFRDRVTRDFDRETGVEIYYSIQVAPWLAVTLDAQFIDAPGGFDSVRDAQVYGIRARASF